MRDVSPGKRLFVIEYEGEPAPEESLQRVAVIARRPRTANGLPVDFSAFAVALLPPDVRAADRACCHDGTDSAAPEAVNDPNKSATPANITIDGHPYPEAGTFDPVPTRTAARIRR